MEPNSSWSGRSDRIDVKLSLVKDGKERTVRAVTTIKDKQAVISKEIDESPASNLFVLSPGTQVVGAKCANVMYKFEQFGKSMFQTDNMVIIPRR